MIIVCTRYIEVGGYDLQKIENLSDSSAKALHLIHASVTSVMRPKAP